MSKFSLALIIFLAGAVVSCQNYLEQTPTEEAMASKKSKIVVYQVFTRLFGNTNTNSIPYGTIHENGVGKFNDFNTKALKAIKELGITHIWYTGVIEHALLTDYTEFGIHLDDADVVKGRAGSPYAIKDYYDVNPDLAVEVNNRMAEFDSLVARTHAQKMKVIIDFVPNHVARYYKSDVNPDGVPDLGENDDPSKAFSANNNFYYIAEGEAFQVPHDYNALGHLQHPTKNTFYSEKPAKATGNDVFSATPSIYDWFETVKLNYGVDYMDNRRTYFDTVPDTWHKMHDILAFWTKKGVDGFRCDMAEMVPVEFWEWVIPKIRAINLEIIFIAEIYVPDNYRKYIHQGQFDYLYDKVELYDTLKHIIQQKATTDDISVIWHRQEGIAHNMLRFLENHDEQRIASPYFAGKAENAIPAMVLSATMNTGPVMIYFGQEVGEPGAGIAGFSGEDGRTTIFDYWGVPEHQKWLNGGKFDGGKLSAEQKKLRQFHQQLLTLCNQYQAITLGGFYDLHYFNRGGNYNGYSNKVYAYLRHHQGENLLFVLNFNIYENEKVRLKLPDHALDVMQIGRDSQLRLVDIFNKQEIWLQAKGLSSVSDPVALELDIPANGFHIFKIDSK